MSIICCSYSVYKSFLDFGITKNIFYVDNSFTLKNVINNRDKICGNLKLFTLSPIIKRKQVLKTIKLFKNVDFDFSFDIYGDGEEREELINLIRNDGRFKYKGFISSDKINFKEYDALVSLSLSEGLPNSVIEALYLGIFAILSPISSHKYISEFSRKALILKNYDESVIKSKLIYLLNNRESIIDLKKFRNYFRKERMINDYKKIYKI